MTPHETYHLYLLIGQSNCVETAGLKHIGDDLHFDGASACELGRRYAKAMAELLQEGGNS